MIGGYDIYDVSVSPSASMRWGHKRQKVEGYDVYESPSGEGHLARGRVRGCELWEAKREETD